MTLIAVRRLNGKVCIAADSRLTFGMAGTFDRAIKIFKVPVKIKGPIQRIEDRDKWEFEHDYGLAIAGSTTNAYTVKESVQAIISSIQYLSNVSDISIVGIASFVHNRFKEISNELAPILREEGLSELIFAGWCLTAEKVRVLRFYPQVTTTEILYRVEEILTEDGWFFAGSGRHAAEQVLQANPDFTPLRLIKTVIEQQMEPTVGGVLQIGKFPKENFIISGVQEDILGEIDHESKSFTHYVGYNLEQKEVTERYPYLFIPHGYTKVDSPWPPVPPIQPEN